MSLLFLSYDTTATTSRSRCPQDLTGKISIQKPFAAADGLTMVAAAAREFLEVVHSVFSRVFVSVFFLLLLLLLSGNVSE